MLTVELCGYLKVLDDSDDPKAAFAPGTPFPILVFMKKREEGRKKEEENIFPSKRFTNTETCQFAKKDYS